MATGDITDLVFDWKLGVGTALIFIGGAMSGSVGIGGGGIYVPVLILLMGIDPKTAIPVSKATIFGLALSTFIVNAGKRHPRANRPLIEYDISLLMSPLNLLGTAVGVTLYSMFPRWFIIILLILLLGITDWRAFVKAFELHRKEKKEQQNRNVNASENEPLINNKLSNPTPKQQKVLDRMSKTPVLKILLLALTWLALFGITFVRGGGESDVSHMGVHKCSEVFWLLGAGLVVVMVLVGLFAAIYVYKNFKARQALEIPLMPGDLRLSKKRILALMATGFGAGTAAGVLGIGSGMVNGPVLLEMGLLPEVATATSAFMIIFTAASTVMQYLLLGQLPYKLGGWFMPVGFLAGLFGNYLISFLVKKYKKSSLISFMLSVVIGLCTIALTVTGVLDLIAQSKEPGSFQFDPYCAGTNTSIWY
eukprot:TRINITY_DN11186_c0_g1_i1.p1 TRINITY_DN11186_c0_g1~~TRINITY_DN11186_c0_g1_i1.p1  ORF type:complete len:421 (-),score=91.31 TRINITY_DN11186_c0_g1_i1:46-1308(-)